MGTKTNLVGEESGEAAGSASRSGSRGTAAAVVAGVGFLVLAVANGVGFYGFPLYINELYDAGFVDSAGLSAATSVSFLSSGLFGLVIGRLLRRGSVAVMTLAGGVGVGFGTFLIGSAGSLVHLLAAYMILGIGTSLCGALPLSTLMMRKVPDSPMRKRALALMLTGMTAGGAIFTPPLSRAVEASGFGPALRVAGLVAGALIGAGAVVLFVMDRRVTSLTPMVPETSSIRPGEPGERGPGRVLGPRFWLVAGSFTLLLAFQVGVTTQLYSLATSRGSAAAATVVAAVATSGIAARLIGVVAVGSISPPAFLRYMAIAQLSGVVVLALARSTSALIVGAVLLGLAVGNASVLQPLVVIELFGPKQYPKVLAASSLVTTFGISAGPYVLGALRGLTGGFLVPSAVAATATALVIVLSKRLGRLISGEGAKA